MSNCPLIGRNLDTPILYYSSRTIAFVIYCVCAGCLSSKHATITFDVLWLIVAIFIVIFMSVLLCG